MNFINRFLIVVVCLLTFQQYYTQVEYDKTDFVAPMHIPLILAGNFAELRSNHFHTGLDIKTKGSEGYRIYAIDSGYVSRINISHWGYGRALYITHLNGYTSVYAHLSRFPDKIEKYLRKKQFEMETETITIYPDSLDLLVSKEEIVAYSGNSGSSGGPHLHFEIRETETEKAVNPLLFGFDVKDDIRPTVSNIKIYPLDNGFINGKDIAKVYPTTGSLGNYSLKDNPVIEVDGEIGVGVHTIDKLNGAGNKCGIYTIELFVDDSLVFRQTMEKIDFFTNRYINAHKDYDEYHNNNRSFHKSYVSDNNKLALYDGLINNGKLFFNDDAIHQLKYIIKDTYGNTSTVTFQVKSHTKMAKKITKTQLVGDTILMAGDVVIEKEGFKAYLPENSVYNDLRAKYKEEEMSKTVSDLHRFGNSKIPVHHYFIMKIKTQNIAKNMENKAVVVSVSDDKRKVYAKGGEYKDGWVQTKVRAFGSYAVKIDSVPPLVTAVNISEGKNLSAAKNIQFKISDNLSGIETYDAFVDGNWVLGNYAPKRATYSIPFDSYNNISKGKHLLKVLVIDERGNAASKEYNFIR